MPKPPSEPFDPCRAWLGIDRADLADPLRVLGLSAGENDPLRVLRAAEKRLAKLKGLAAGEHHAAREALILRVEQAREAVLSRIARSGPPTAPSPFSMPPPPRAARGESEDAHVTFDTADEATAEPMQAPVVRLRGRRPVRRGGNAAIWVSVLAVLASVAVFAAFIWWQGQREAQKQAARAAAKAAEAREAAAEPPAEAEPRRPPHASGRPGSMLPEDALVSTSPPPSRESRPPRPAPPRRDPPMAAGTIADDPADAAMEPEGDDPPAESTDDPAMTDAPDGPAMTEAADDPPDTPTDDPETGSDPADTDASEADAAAGEALAAIRAGEFDTADAVLASALESAGGVAAKRRISDWQVLAQYARDFAGFREKALSEVKPGNEFDVNGKVVAVVEIDEKKFVYRFQGRNRTSPRDKIPAGIAYAIVSGWFDARPANQLFLGAWHATKPEPDAAKARECWQRAEKGGLSAEPLLRLLDDPALAGDGAAAAADDER